jgi:hypothetical protein
MTLEINWAAPVIGKLEVGKTYVDRRGYRHTLTNPVGNEVRSWWAGGMFGESSDQRHVLDLIAEHKTMLPHKAWANIYPDGSGDFFTDSENARQMTHPDHALIAVPVTLTEGH